MIASLTCRKAPFFVLKVPWYCADVSFFPTERLTKLELNLYQINYITSCFFFFRWVFMLFWHCVMCAVYHSERVSALVDWKLQVLRVSISLVDWIANKIAIESVHENGMIYSATVVDVDHNGKLTHTYRRYKNFFVRYCSYHAISKENREKKLNSERNNSQNSSKPNKQFLRLFDTVMEVFLAFKFWSNQT